MHKTQIIDYNVLPSNPIAEFFDYQCLWKETDRYSYSRFHKYSHRKDSIRDFYCLLVVARRIQQSPDLPRRTRGEFGFSRGCMGALKINQSEKVDKF